MRHYLAPEIRLKPEISEASDIWALGCVFYELYAGQSLFVTFESQDETFSHLVHILGRFPSRWWDTWYGRHKYFEEDGTPKEEPEEEELPLGELIANIGTKAFFTYFGVSLSKEEFESSNAQ